MHDLLLAKEILETSLKYAKDKGLDSLSEIMIELGQIEEHAEEVSASNLKELFSLISKNTAAEKAKLKIKKASSSHWKLQYIK